MRLKLKIILLLVSSCTPPALSDEPVRTESKQGQSDIPKNIKGDLQGDWICIWDQRDGKVDKNEIDTVFRFIGNEMTHIFSDGRTDKWKFQIRVTVDPMEINWTHSDKGTRERGIFWLRGDTLVFCDGFPLDKRPKNFSDGSHLNVFRRMNSKKQSSDNAN